MQHFERIPYDVNGFGERLAQEVTELVLLSDPKLVELDRVLKQKRGCRR